MADDYLLSALAGVSKGISNVLVPYFERQNRMAELERKIRAETELKSKEAAQRESELFIESPELKFGEDITIPAGRYNKDVFKAMQPQPVYNPKTGTIEYVQGGRSLVQLKPGMPKLGEGETETPEQRAERIRMDARARAEETAAVKLENEPLPSGETGRLTLSRQGIRNVEKSKNVLFPTGKPESFRRELAIEAKLPTPLSEEAQDVRRWMLEAIKGKILIETGVAASPGEAEQKLDLYVAGGTSNPKSFMKALSELNEFYNDYLTITKTRGRDLKKEPKKEDRGKESESDPLGLFQQ